MLAVLSTPAIPRVAVLLAATALVVAPAIFPFVSRTTPDVSYENRRPSGVPDNTLSWNDQIQGYQRFFEDRIGWRRQFIAMRNRLADLVGLSPNPLVRAGKDGWLFNLHDMALANRAGLLQLSDKEVGRIRDEVEARTQFWAQRGIDYFFVVGPDKSSIVPERLDNLFPVGETAFDHVYLRHGKAVFGPRFIDPRERLREARSGTYFKTDSHWNVIGSRVAYDVLMDRVTEARPEVVRLPSSSYRIATRAYNGDLVPIGLEMVYPDREPYLLPDASGCGRQLELPKLPWAGYAASFQPGRSGCDTGRLNALIIHDSFGMALQPYLKRTFAQAMFFWTPRGEEVPGELVEQAKSIMGHVDVIIQERVERAFLRRATKKTGRP